MADRDPDDVFCRICGCMDSTPCRPTGCSWVPDPLEQGDLCSACLDRAVELGADWAMPAS